MDSSQLDALEKLAAQATPGPWEVDGTTEHNGRYTRQSLYLIVDGWQRGTLSNDSEEEKKDAAYIVAACNAVPELVERVRELEETAIMFQIENDTINELREAHRKQWEERVRELERQNAGLESRLRYLTEERDTLEWELNDIKRGLEAAEEG